MITYRGRDTKTSIDVKSLGLTKVRYQALPKVRKVYLIDVGLNRTAYCVYNNSMSNAIRSVAERVLLEKHDDDWGPVTPGNKEVFFSRLKAFRIKLVKRIGARGKWESNEFISSCDSKKRKVYENAELSLKERPITPKDAEIKAFVKCEKLPATHEKPDPCPRLIQPRDPRFNLMVGKYIKPLEKVIYSCMSRVIGGTAVLKGYNSRDRGRILRNKWNKFINPVCVGLDASRFDQHVRRFALEWCYSIYNNAYSDPELRMLLKMCLRNIVWVRCSDGSFRFEVDGGRCSGDMDTSLGNCLLTIAMLYSYCKGKNIEAAICCDGDDALAFMESNMVGTFLDGIEEWYLDMGFVMKVDKPVSIFEHIEFCKCHPVYDGKDWIMLRDPKAIIRDLISILPLKDKCRDYLHSIGSCGLALNSGFPVLQAFYSQLEKIKGKMVKHHVFEDYGLFHLTRGMKAEVRSITQAARFSFYLAFGIDPDVQVELESQFSCMKVDINAYEDIDDFLDPFAKSTTWQTCCSHNNLL